MEITAFIRERVDFEVFLWEAVAEIEFGPLDGIVICSLRGQKCYPSRTRSTPCLDLNDIFGTKKKYKEILMASENQCLKLNSDDNVAMAIKDIAPGDQLVQGLACLDRIPAGHKVALRAIEAGELILKYGQPICRASRQIAAGEHVHTHNTAMAERAKEYDIGSAARSTNFVAPDQRARFKGYLNSAGRVGTRNYVGVLATSCCSTSVAKFIADEFREVNTEFPNVDGVVGLGHGSGCGMAASGEGFDYLQRVIDGLCKHPNFAGVVLVGLGCEVNNLDSLCRNLSLETGDGLKMVEIQDGGTPETVRRGVEAVREMLAQADQRTRQEVSAEHLIIGLECGGSDAWSGITANPALGAASNLVVQHGGTVILSETPEIYGAEHLLARRAASRAVGEKLLERIRWWEDYTGRLGGSMNNNPSPGNKAGGLTTILEKSLGASVKCGTTDLMEVYGYAEPVTGKGFVFMDTPGYDVVSITGLVAGGANLICFTTGRGTVYGCKPVPILKLASNSEMYRRLKSHMDLDCGPIARGEVNLEEMGRVIFERILSVASGERTKSEIFGLGDNELVPWQIGAVM